MTISIISPRISSNISIIAILKYKVVLLIVNRYSFFIQVVKILDLYSSSNQVFLNLLLKSSSIIRYQYYIVLLYLIGVLLKLNRVLSRRLLLSKILNNPSYRTFFIRRSKYSSYFQNKIIQIFYLTFNILFFVSFRVSKVSSKKQLNLNLSSFSY